MKPDFETNCGFCGKLFIVKRKSYLDQIRRNSNHTFYCSDECRREKAKTGQYINCLICGKEVYKKLNEIEAGARFCSSSCAAQYNNQIRLTTKGKLKNLICAKCGCEYIGSIHTPTSTGLCDLCGSESNCIDCGAIIHGSSGIKYCDFCRTKIVSTKIKNRINNGTLFSKAIKCEYMFNDKKIRCDSKLEYVCLTYFQSTYDVLDMKRADMVIAYIFDEKICHYYPDFEISLKDGTKYLIECKGVVGKKLSDKWHDYNKKAVEKKKVLEKWCQENGYIPFWFDQQRHNKIYKNTKIDA